MDEGDLLKKAKAGLLRQLARRPRLEAEAHAYLEKKGLTGEKREALIAEMKGFGYLNDEKYVIDYITYRQEQGFGAKRIRYDLLIRGAKRQHVEELLNKVYETEAELPRAEELIKRKALRSEGACDEKWAARQAAFLQRRGFRESVVYEAIKRYLL